MTRCLVLLSALLAWFLIGSQVSAQEAEQNGVEFFEKRIRPILVQNCYACHSEKAQAEGKLKGGLLVDSRDGLRRGGESGPAVSPGDADDSLILSALKHESFEMPPKGKLPDAVIADFAKWVEIGAPDPRDGDAVVVQTKIDFEKGRQFWSFQPVEAVQPPAVQDAAWPKSEIDRFVLAKLEGAGLKPVNDADPRVLVRRLYFDLIGLPPSPEEADRFVQAASRNPESAIEELVDQLLDSPHFGERWGRHWMDVVRFAESNGRERNYLYPHAWRYRDWVIGALNEDKPYDRFITEQIAGDLLPADNPQQKNEQLVATGFLAIGAKLLNERNQEVFRMDMVDEQIDVTTRSVMALTAACARCHDHKFDPIPTQEYYALAGVFRSTETLFGTTGRGNRQPSKLIALTGGADAGAKEEQPSPQDQRVARLRKELREAQQQLKQLAGGKKRKGKPELAQLRRRVKQLNQQIARAGGGGGAAQTGPLAMGVEEGSAEDCPVYIRGEVTDRGPVVPRGFLTIATNGEAPTIAKDASGRLELAHWLTSPDNPLTARVMANRVWHYLFGQGLVRTVDNFGATGERPSHPELLDHLAAGFASDGWSVKRLVRRVVLSRTYQLASDYDAAAYEADPENRLVWRMNPRRLDAESIRDAILAVSGQLERAPYQGSLVTAAGGNNKNGEVAPGDYTRAEHNHRSVYLPIVRNAVPQTLDVFDFAEPSIIVGHRDVTTVPAQALYMMNSEFIVQQAEHFAARLLKDEQMSDAERVRLAYDLALCREPTGTEAERATGFINRIHESLATEKKNADPMQRLAWTSFCQALLASAEFRYLD